MTAISIYRCPSSNGNNLFTLEGRTRGPLADYVVLVAKVDRPGSSASDRAPGRGWWHRYNLFGEATGNDQWDRRTYVGPLRLPSLTFFPGTGALNTVDGNAHWARSIADWTYDDTMARWMRGTSNQLVFSEKHIPAHALRPTQHVRAEQSRWNGNYMYSGRGEYAHNVARLVWDRDVFASSPQQPETVVPANRGPHADVPGVTGGGLEGRFTLGSSHPGVVNMVLGDGSVRPVSKSTNSRLMWDLTNVESGVAASLP